ncbi:MAG: hypothetical protein D6729_04340 [Deltaproteobacteria bacterium]|nr:MAG: hypothetical protein D6729_04340 [Deltaproteobacteria bacterium]
MVEQGQWLFKERDLLMGPVPAKVLIDKLYAGEIDGETQVASEAEEVWRPLREVDLFRVHIAKAEARLRVMREKAQAQAQARRRKARLAVLLSAAAVLLAVVVATGVWWLVTSSAEREAEGALADLGITVSPPVIELALADQPPRREGAWLDVDVDVEEAPSAAPPTRTPARRRPLARGSTGGRPPAKGAPGPEPPAPRAPKTPPEGEGVGLKAAYDMNHINAVVRRQSRTLFPCIKAEVKRTGFRGVLPFEFVVKNDGRVGKIWIDRKELRGTPLEKCFAETMAKWRFNPFPGPRPTVKQSFTIGG